MVRSWLAWQSAIMYPAFFILTDFHSFIHLFRFPACFDEQTAFCRVCTLSPRITAWQSSCANVGLPARFRIEFWICWAMPSIMSRLSFGLSGVLLPWVLGLLFSLGSCSHPLFGFMTCHLASPHTMYLPRFNFVL